MKRYLTLLLLQISLTANAQQTIFDVPSADVTDKGHVYLESESQFRFWHPGAFWGGTEYFAYGVGFNTDVESTLYNVSDPHSDNISLGLGFKSFIPLLKSQLPNTELKLTIGDQVVPSLQGHGLGDWTYTHLSGRLPIIKTRLTAGISAGTSQIFGRDTVHFIGGYEQPITKNFSIIGDYFSGAQALGYFINGISYALPVNYTLFAGYQIPNARRIGKSGFVFELAKIF